MIKVVGYQIKEQKKIVYSLQTIYGIGLSKSLEICKRWNVNPALKWIEIDQGTQYEIINYIEKHIKTGQQISRLQKQYIDNYKKNGSNRGFRHKRGLPVNGQRTHSNAKSFKRILGLIKKTKRK